MSKLGFEAVVAWIRSERATYQTRKFDYAAEAEKIDTPAYWLQQLASYEQRIEAFGLSDPNGVQAALKLAATALAMCEHLADRGELPLPGLPSGETRFATD